MTAWRDREEWDQYCAMLRANHVTPHPVPWPLATWQERLALLGLWTVCAIVAIVIAYGILAMIGIGSDSLIDHLTEHDRCLHAAETGYEIKLCR